MMLCYLTTSNLLILSFPVAFRTIFDSPMTKIIHFIQKLTIRLIRLVPVASLVEGVYLHLSGRLPIRNIAFFFFKTLQVFSSIPYSK